MILLNSNNIGVKLKTKVANSGNEYGIAFNDQCKKQIKMEGHTDEKNGTNDT